MVTKIDLKTTFRVKLSEVDCNLSDLISVLLKISKQYDTLCKCRIPIHQIHLSSLGTLLSCKVKGEAGGRVGQLEQGSHGYTHGTQV